MTSPVLLDLKKKTHLGIAIATQHFIFVWLFVCKIPKLATIFLKRFKLF
jgi:hypothetical protein